MTASPSPPPAPSAPIGLDTLIQKVFALTPDLAAVIIDHDFRIVYCNAAASFFGHLAGDALGQRIPDIHDRLGVPNEPFYRAAEKVRGGVDHVFPQRVTLPDGLHFLESRMLALFEADKVVGYALLSRDLTRQLKAETREQLLVRTVEHNPAAIIVTDRNGLVEFVNRRFTELTGYEASDVIGRRPGTIRSGSTPGEVYKNLWQTISSGREWVGELLNRHRNGEPRWHNIRIMPILGPDGEIEHFVSVQEDITERKNGEESLRLSAKMLEESGEAVMITDAENRIVSVNRAFSDITGYAMAEVIGHKPSMLGSGRHGPEFFAEMWQTLKQKGRWQGEIWDRRKSGEVYPKWLGISAVYDGTARLTHYLAIFSDITERKAAEERIAFLAYHDPLTGLPNRILLRDRFEQAIAYASRSQSSVAFLFLDLDRFKTVNDTLGHVVGDRLLQGVVERLQACIRQTDTVSRQGGDEFTVILSEIRSAQDAADVAQKILDCFVEPIAIETHRLSVSFSIGISLYPSDGEDFDTLLKKADTAMYDAKEGGRNAYRFFAERMNERVSERLLLQNRLALALVDEELEVHYQPLMNIESGQIIGAEALLRWNSRELGMLQPGRFIPVAEDTGLIVPIGAWVLRQACRQAAVWRADGRPLTMAVNISPTQFQRGDLLDTVRSALHESGLPPELLELELTESILIQDVDKVLEKIAQLKELGVRLAIDDFGTGYSSLSYLKRFAVHKLKIDRSFVHDILSDPDDAAIVRTIIQMARNLKLHTVAEGVEDPLQLQYLYQEGCDIAQGYFFSRPVPAPEFSRLLADSRP